MIVSEGNAVLRIEEKIYIFLTTHTPSITVAIFMVRPPSFHRGLHVQECQINAHTYIPICKIM